MGNYWIYIVLRCCCWLGTNVRRWCKHVILNVFACHRAPLFPIRERQMNVEMRKRHWWHPYSIPHTIVAWDGRARSSKRNRVLCAGEYVQRVCERKYHSFIPFRLKILFRFSFLPLSFGRIAKRTAHTTLADYVTAIYLICDDVSWLFISTFFLCVFFFSFCAAAECMIVHTVHMVRATHDSLPTSPRIHCVHMYMFSATHLRLICYYKCFDVLHCCCCIFTLWCICMYSLRASHSEMAA